MVGGPLFPYRHIAMEFPTPLMWLLNVVVVECGDLRTQSYHPLRCDIVVMQIEQFELPQPSRASQRLGPFISQRPQRQVESLDGGGDPHFRQQSGGSVGMAVVSQSQVGE